MEVLIMDNKKKLTFIGILAVVSIVVATYNNAKLNKGQTDDSKQIIQIETPSKLESKESDIEEEEELPNEGDEEMQTIWIKNLSFLAKEQEYDKLMKLQSKLNTELKTLDKNIYEVNLLEDTYKVTDKGFIIEAKADKLEGKILIEYKDYEFIFQIEH
jgi:hypothetical protein